MRRTITALAFIVSTPLFAGAVSLLPDPQVTALASEISGESAKRNLERAFERAFERTLKGHLKKDIVKKDIGVRPAFRTDLFGVTFLAGTHIGSFREEVQRALVKIDDCGMRR